MVERHTVSEQRSMRRSNTLKNSRKALCFDRCIISGILSLFLTWLFKRLSFYVLHIFIPTTHGQILTLKTWTLVSLNFQCYFSSITHATMLFSKESRLISRHICILFLYWLMILGLVKLIPLGYIFKLEKTSNTKIYIN